MRRLVITLHVLALLSACAEKEVVVDKQKFEPVFRAATAVTSATSVGVSYLKFMELLQNVATEVNVGRTKVGNDRERLMIEKYSGALGLYQQTAELWKKGIDNGVDNKPKVQEQWGVASSVLDDANLIYENKPKPMPGS
jgi:hypothetical protein